VHLQGLEPWAH